MAEDEEDTVGEWIGRMEEENDRPTVISTSSSSFLCRPHVSNSLFFLAGSGQLVKENVINERVRRWTKDAFTTRSSTLRSYVWIPLDRILGWKVVTRSLNDPRFQPKGRSVRSYLSRCRARHPFFLAAAKNHFFLWPPLWKERKCQDGWWKRNTTCPHLCSHREVVSNLSKGVTWWSCLLFSSGTWSPQVTFFKRSVDQLSFL